MQISSKKIPDMSVDVSIIIPTYNRLSMLEEALSSVYAQDFDGVVEIIVVDDNSQDGTEEQITANYPDIRLIRLLQNRGAAGARNEGIRTAKGSIIAFLDSDDRWLPNYLEQQVKALQKNPQAVLSFCDFIEINEADNSSKEVKANYSSQATDPIHFQLFNSLIFTMSIVTISRQALLEVGLLNEGLKISHDRELYLRLAQLGELIYIPDTFAIRKINASGDNVSINVRQSMKESFQVLDLFFSSPGGQLYKSVEADARSQWSRRFARRIWQTERNFLLMLKLHIKAFWVSPKLHISKILEKTSNKLISTVK